jgi:hypothetical protein
VTSTRNPSGRAVLAVSVMLVSSPTFPAFFSPKSQAFACPLASRPRAPTSSIAAVHGACRSGLSPATLRAWVCSRRPSPSPSVLRIKNHAP